MRSAIMLDIIDSRGYTVEQRGEIQSYINLIRAAMNDVFRRELEREADFSAGDEIQGLFRHPWGAYLYVRLFLMLMRPVRLRGGIGVGSWDVRLENAGTTAQDGQVYYRARQAIKDAEEQELYGTLYCSGGESDAVINSLMASSDTVRGDGAYQNEIALLTELISPIDCGGCIDIDRLPALWDAVKRRREFRYYAPYIPKRSPFDRPCPTEIKPVNAEDDNGYFVTAGKPRGLPVIVSEYMGVSRQSIDKTLKTSNIFTSRSLAVAAVRAMKMAWNDTEE